MNIKNKIYIKLKVRKTSSDLLLFLCLALPHLASRFLSFIFAHLLNMLANFATGLFCFCTSLAMIVAPIYMSLKALLYNSFKKKDRVFLYFFLFFCYIFILIFMRNDSIQSFFLCCNFFFKYAFFQVINIR